MPKRFLIPVLILYITALNACSKIIDNTGGTSGGGGTTTTDTASNPLQSAVGTNYYMAGIYTFFKFINVMDYGNVTVLMNDTTLSSVALYYPTAYYKTAKRKANIKIIFNNIKVLSQDVDAPVNNFYSVYVYKVGNEWKISVVNDAPNRMTSAKAGIRVLDFRTQAYFDYVNVRFTSPGFDQLDYTARNFLDHTTFSSYTKFDSLQSASAYYCYVFNDTANLVKKTGITFDAGKYYSVVLLTPPSKSAADALFSITLDIEKHN
jgi:hypothetical protein